MPIQYTFVPKLHFLTNICLKIVYPCLCDLSESDIAARQEDPFFDLNLDIRNAIYGTVI